MDNRLKRSAIDCIVIIANACTSACEALKSAIDALAAAAICAVPDRTSEDKMQDPYEAMMRALKEIGGNIDSEIMQELAKTAEDLPPITQKKIPRPPKSIGPVNKANYTANRPLRNARSSCRIIKRR